MKKHQIPSMHWLYTSEQSPVRFNSYSKIKLYLYKLLHKKDKDVYKEALKDLNEYAKTTEFGTHAGIKAKKVGVFNYYSFPHRDELFEVDLMDVRGERGRKERRINNGYLYIMLVINCGTEKLWYKLLKSKKGHEVGAALTELFEEINPKRKGFTTVLLHADKGREFLQLCSSCKTESYKRTAL